MAIERTPVRATSEPGKFPFGVEFQKSLLRLLTVDAGFAHAAVPYLEPNYFENEVLSWAYAYLKKYREEFNAVPPLTIIFEETKNLDVNIREFYRTTLEAVNTADVSIDAWLKQQTLDFVKRNIFVASFKESKHLYNQGEADNAFDMMRECMDRIENTAWEPPDRSFFFEEFAQRTSDRVAKDPLGDTIPTGIHDLDKILEGGLSKGELGIWIGYPKRGKTTMLTNLGVQAVRRALKPTAHFVLEGSRRQVENRYDTIFAQEAYQQVKVGNYSAEAFQRMQYEYEMFGRKLVVRGFTERWDYNANDLLEELRDLKRAYQWEPELVVVDYGDLMRGRAKDYDNETAEQRAAFRDLKSLANMGYGVWTASQARRPKGDIDSDPEVLRSKEIAECYDKVRVADFIGSVNQTKEEKLAKQMRLFAELYRDNDAGIVIPVIADFGRMTITVVRDPNQQVLPSPVTQPVPLGYKHGMPVQRKAQI